MLNPKHLVSIFLFAALPFLMLTGCNSGGISSDKNVNLETTIDSVSYGIGRLYGSQMRQQGMTDLKPKKLMAGLKGALEDTDAQIDRQQIQQLVQTYQIKAQQNAQKMKQEESEKNQQVAQKFLDENISKEGVNMTESGLQYKVIEEGSGASPTAEDTVTVHYEGTLIDGTVFDSSYERKQTATFPLNRVIAGWTEGLQLMKEGATYKFWIPGELAYGQNPPPGSPIGAGELLIFKIELMEVK